MTIPRSCPSPHLEARMSRGELSDVHETGSARTRFALLAGLFVSLLALVLAVPGTASAAPTAARNHVSHPELDWMGSTIKSHEGNGQSGAGTVTPMVTETPGMDVSGYQGNVNWSAAWSNGGKFAYIKA